VSYTPGKSELVDGALAGTLVVRKPAPSTKWQAVALRPVPTIGYVETIRIAGVADEPGMGVDSVVDFLVEGVQMTLDEMKSAGA
jgi:hypothetical protein